MKDSHKPFGEAGGFPATSKFPITEFADADMSRTTTLWGPPTGKGPPVAGERPFSCMLPDASFHLATSCLSFKSSVLPPQAG